MTPLIVMYRFADIVRTLVDYPHMINWDYIKHETDRMIDLAPWLVERYEWLKVIRETPAPELGAKLDQIREMMVGKGRR